MARVQHDLRTGCFRAYYKCGIFRCLTIAESVRSPWLLECHVPNNFRFSERGLACPYFMPVERLENGAWPHPARLPLGSGWSGHCTAPGHEGEVPAQDVLEAFCNLGYASSCGWAPCGRQWDAVRFAVMPPSESDRTVQSEENSGAGSLLIRVRYACEREHRPAAHGDLEFDLHRSQWTRRHEDERIQKMAECYLESYLKKKS